MKKPKVSARIEKLIKERSGIKLDIGCGQGKQPGFVGLDMVAYPNVDIVHDAEVFPWPLPDECVTLSVASHLVEHINPHKGVFLDFMNEIWRIMKVGGQFVIVTPYAGSTGYFQDPTHCNPCNENTWKYFDPLDTKVGGALYLFYKPKPWKIKFSAYRRNGNMEVILVKRKEDPSYTLQKRKLSEEGKEKDEVTRKAL